MVCCQRRGTGPAQQGSAGWPPSACRCPRPLANRPAGSPLWRGPEWARPVRRGGFGHTPSVKRIALLLLLAALATAGMYGREATGSIRIAPTLQIVGPMVKGQGFGAREAVRVSFSAEGVRFARLVRAGPSGAFLTRVPVLGPCAGTLMVVARGRTGDQARLRLLSKSCGPALGPAG